MLLESVLLDGNPDMKTWIVVSVAAILGLGVGVGSALVRLEQAPWDGSAAPTKPNESAATIPTGPHPTAVAETDKHDFGALDSHATGRHSFVIKNTGQAVLKLTKGSTSCKCTASLLGDNAESADVPTGGSTEVTLEWKGKGFKGPFNQTATINTNDPEHPRLTFTISGRIVTAVSIAPTNLVLSGITAGEPATGELKLFGYLEKPLKITGYEVTDKTTADKFDLAFEPLPPEEIAKEQDARSGQIVRVTVKPGLPLGAFQQKIVLKTDAENAPTVEIPVQGTISSEIAIIGSGWDDGRQILSLGTVSSQAGLERTIRILVRGPERNDVKIKPLSATPSLLQVETGIPTEWQGGQVVQIPLTVRIPKGARPAHYLGTDEDKLAQITLETTHSKAPQLRLLVRFAVVN
ncbi:MAG: DUF1573 domain-containing protein [Pirellulales bacterium]|nr:DUF1573 domain-containing protein [Pirellulales bacterium]